jgi:hypothetical protein
MTGKKSFFNERTTAEIRKLNLSSGYNHNDLVQRIDDLDPTKDALGIRTLLIPSRFRRRNTSAQASRKCYKHGSLIALTQPTGLKESYEWADIPLDLRAASFAHLSKMDQARINYLGYSFRPVFGRDREKRIVPFVNLAEGARIFTYAETHSAFRQKNIQTDKMEAKKGIKVESYQNSKRVLREGASVVVNIPSRSKKKPKYKFRLSHVPYVPNSPGSDSNYGLAVSLSLKPTLTSEITEQETEKEATNQRTEHTKYDMRYTYQQSRDQSGIIRFSPQDVAGYLGVIKRQLTEEHNITGLTFNPFALPSKHQAEFYTKLCNNVLAFDPNLTSKHKLRKLHLAEKSILLGRAIGHFGHENFAFWDPVRDGIYSSFNWK